MKSPLHAPDRVLMSAIIGDLNASIPAVGSTHNSTYVGGYPQSKEANSGIIKRTYRSPNRCDVSLLILEFAALSTYSHHWIALTIATFIGVCFAESSICAGCPASKSFFGLKFVI